MKIEDIKFMTKEKEKARESSIFKRMKQTTIIADKFCGSKTDLDVAIFKQPDFPERFIDWLKENYALNTQKSYIGVISSLSYSIDIPVSCLKKLKDYANSMGTIKSSTKVDDKYMENLNNAYGKHSKSIDMIITVVKHVGAIRLFELINTKVANRDDNKNYLDLNTRVWHFTVSGTKNKIARSFEISQSAVNAIKQHLWCGAEYLILSKSLKPYNDTHSLSVLYKAATGITYLQTRKSFIDLANRKRDSSYLIKLANIMGHTPATQLTHYKSEEPVVKKPVVRVTLKKPKIKVTVKKRI